MLLALTPEDLALMNGKDSDDAKGGSTFEVDFDFMGCVEFQFNLWKVNRDGDSVGGAQSKAPWRMDFSHLSTKVKISARNLHDLSHTNLTFLQGKNYRRVSQWHDVRPWSQHAGDSRNSADGFQCDMNTFLSYHCKSIPDFKIPWIIDEDAASGLQVMIPSLAKDHCPSWFDCSCAPCTHDDETIPRQKDMQNYTVAGLPS